MVPTLEDFSTKRLDKINNYVVKSSPNITPPYLLKNLVEIVQFDHQLHFPSLLKTILNKFFNEIFKKLRIN